MKRWPFVRDVAFTVAGLAGLAFMFASGHSDPTLVLACLALLGLPIPLRKDERTNGEDK